MADQIKSDVVTHYPIHPFGKHAGTYAISITLARNYEGDPIPLSGCTLEEPLDDDAKTVLCGLALARIDSAGRFVVDYAALRAHLRTVCGVLSEDLSGLTWATIMALICRGQNADSERLPPLSKAAALIYEKLLSLKSHEAMLTRQIQDWYEVETKANLDEGTWKNLRKEMEPYGLKNRRRVGYYIDQKMTL